MDVRVEGGPQESTILVTTKCLENTSINLCSIYIYIHIGVTLITGHMDTSNAEHNSIVGRDSWK